MKQKLLITLADKNYVEQAKQLFSGAYWNAGWDGDFMLLSHEIPDEKLKWFADKGILIKKCKPIHDQTVGKDYNPVVLDKLYIFSAEFKKWNNIIFIDSDVIIRGSLDRLTKTKGFGAIFSNLKLSEQFSHKTDQYNDLRQAYNLNKRSFNTGVMAFSTDLIREDTLEKLMGLYEHFKSAVFFPEEAVLNLFFYKKWIQLSRVYDLYVPILLIHKVMYDKIKAVVLHFIRIPGYDNMKPWCPENPFYDEWKANLEKAESIDLKCVQKAREWRLSRILSYTLYYDFYFFYIFHFFKPVQIIRNAVIFIFHLPERIIGLAGIIIKKMSPELHHNIKSFMKLKRKNK